jgi:hypothetical protein
MLEALSELHAAGFVHNNAHYEAIAMVAKTSYR